MDMRCHCPRHRPDLEEQAQIAWAVYGDCDCPGCASVLEDFLSGDGGFIISPILGSERVVARPFVDGYPVIGIAYND